MIFTSYIKEFRQNSNNKTLHENNRREGSAHAA